MIIGFVFIVLLLEDSVLGNDCTETFTEPGNITTTTTFTSLNPSLPPHPIFCEYFIQAPKNSIIELNFTKVHLRKHASQKAASWSSSSVSSLSASTTRSYGSKPDSSSSSTLQQQQQSSASSSSASSSGSASSSSYYPSKKGGGGTPTDCLPNILVVEVTATGREQTLRHLCIQQNHDLKTPQVFRSNTPLIKLNYSWESGQALSFEVSFVFHPWASPCVYRCEDSGCLPDFTLVCNGVADCRDRSDERNCSVDKESSHFLEVLVIVIVVVFTLGVVCCVFFHYRLTSRLWRDRHRGDSGGSTEHHHLNPHSPQATEVVYVPSTPMDRVEREVALQRERQKRLQAIQTDMELNLPPAISISEDGEEGYVQSQRLLQQSCEQKRGESIRPPPNKTVFQGDSPPPYRSHSVGKLDGHYYGKRGSGGLHHSYPPAACLVGPKSGIVPRCPTCSISAGEKRLPNYPGHQVRHSVLPPSGPMQVAPGCGSSHASLTHSSHHAPHPFSSTSGHRVGNDGPGGTSTGGDTNHQQVQSATGGGRICSHPGGGGGGHAWNSAHSTQNNNNHSNHSGCQDNRSPTSYYRPPPEYTQTAKEPLTGPSSGGGTDSSCNMIQTVQSNAVV